MHPVLVVDGLQNVPGFARGSPSPFEQAYTLTQVHEIISGLSKIVELSSSAPTQS